jgi:hypothetical protein
MPVASTHGSKAAVSIDGSALGTWVTNSELKRVADKSEVSGFGSVGHEYADDEGLKAHVFTCSGWYDRTATTGTSAVLKGKEGQNLPIVYGEEGSATGKPRATFTAHLDDYTTTVVYNDIVKWSASFTVSGVITDDVYP